MILLLLPLAVASAVTVTNLRVNHIVAQPPHTPPPPFNHPHAERLFGAYSWRSPVVEPHHMLEGATLSFDVESSCLPECRGMKISSYEAELKETLSNAVFDFSASGEEALERKIFVDASKLKHNTEYEFRFRVATQDPELESEWSPWGSFRTSPSDV